MLLLLIWTASVDEWSRLWKTASTPSSSTSAVETFSSPPLAKMQLAATRCSTALPNRPESDAGIRAGRLASGANDARDSLGGFGRLLVRPHAYRKPASRR